MSKRQAEDGEERAQKRQKVATSTIPAIEEVTSARQLQQSLAFQQDAGPQLSKGIKQFKVFLESIVYAADKSATLPQQAILKEYLESQIPKHGADSETPFLANIMQTWSFAAQGNNDALQSATSSVLALLLKTMSTLIDFRDLAIQLCKTLLQQAQLKLVSRALGASRHKEHVISPCLRLLTEMVSFDGGAMAKNVYSAKTFSFDGKVLARNLSLWKAVSDDVEEARRRPSVRSNTLRYILANFKFQSSSAKGEILKYGNLLRAMFEHLKDDPAELLKETLDIIKINVLMDEAIPRNNKSYLLNEHNLSKIASIYRQERSPNSLAVGQTSPTTLAHAFLKFVCTNPSAGILRSATGWYPAGTDKKPSVVDQEYDLPEIDLGLASVDWYERFHKHVPIRNGILGSFAQTLRPYASTQESELLIGILQSAPELVADYFFKKSGFAFDPKLTATWIGYSSFLFTAVQLPVPIYCGRKDGYHGIPPPVSLVVENILPQPLDQKVLTRCLNQQVDLITFFALRLLIVAFEKLRRVLALFKAASKEQGSLWDEGAARLIAAFSLRCPRMKDIIGTFRRTSVENTLQREASLRLLLLYYEILPHLAFEEKFDVSVVLADAMRALENPSSTNDTAQNTSVTTQDAEHVQLLELSHLLQIARWSPDMRWWNKSENMELSPFTILLKVLSTTRQQKVPASIRQLLLSIVDEHGIMLKDNRESALSALIASLSHDHDFSTSEGLYQFLDDAFARLTRKPIKYQDDMDHIVSAKQDCKPVSLLLMTLAEQWSFASKSESCLCVAEWLGRLMQCLGRAGEDIVVLDSISVNMSRDADGKQQRKLLMRRDNQQLNTTFDNLLRQDNSATSTASEQAKVTRPLERNPIDPSSFAPPAEDSKHSGLHRWSTTDPQTAITSGHLPPLILCLSSIDPSVRRLALTNLHILMTRLPPLKSAFPDSPQFYLLLGILTTTATSYILADQPVPYVCTVYAATAADVLLDPLHPLYEKICRFHTRGPKWDVEHLPSYWTHQILYTPPVEAHDMPLRTHASSAPGTTPSTSTHQHPQSPSAASLTFLLTYLYTSLRTPADLEILRKRNTFEPVLAAAAANPFFPRNCAQLVLKMLWRATCVDGGSTMLMTRKAVVSWLGARIAVGRNGGFVAGSGKEEKEDGGTVSIMGVEGLKQLVGRFWETCDRERVDAWSGGLMEGIVRGLIDS